MSWLDNVCVKKPHNCLRNDKCPPNTDCCAEKNSNIGTCVAKGSCNRDTGHPTISTTNKCPQENYVEGYSDNSEDVCSCTNWKWAMSIVILIALMFGIAFLHVGLKYKAIVG